MILILYIFPDIGHNHTLITVNQIMEAMIHIVPLPDIFTVLTPYHTHTPRHPVLSITAKEDKINMDMLEVQGSQDMK